MESGRTQRIDVETGVGLPSNSELKTQSLSKFSTHERHLSMLDSVCTHETCSVHSLPRPINSRESVIWDLRLEVNKSKATI